MDRPGSKLHKKEVVEAVSVMEVVLQCTQADLTP